MEVRKVRIESPRDLTADWLTAMLGAEVTDFECQRIGTGQMSECYRVSVDYAEASSAPPSVILKVAATDPTSRQTGLAMGLYEREVRFYSEIAPRISGPVARCHHAAIDTESGVFDLLLDDVAPAEPGNELIGATLEQAVLAVTELGRIRASVLAVGDLTELSWLNRESPVDQAMLRQLYAVFVDRFGDQLTDQQRMVCQRLVDGFDGYRAAESGRAAGLVHGDFRLDNMLFGRDGAPGLTVVDWQTVTWGPVYTDLAYFLGCSLPVEVRRANIDMLIAAYLDGLGLESGITEHDVRAGIRRASFFGVMMAIVSSMLVERTDRGDRMFLTMLERHCAQVIDTDALAELPSPESLEPLRPSESDEGPHVPDGAPLWNESWYFDFVDEQQRLGGWIRLGLYPNAGKSWINALLCGPGLPTVALNDFHAPVPDDAARVRSGDIELTQDVVIALSEYRVAVRGTGQAYDDPASLLRGEPGRPVEVSMDLVWHTAGLPYRYRMATRYEIPCTVSGVVVVDGVSYPVESGPGQRDHSWGVRDWWAMDWVWSAVHLDDGTHLHAVDIRIPGAPPIGIGYAQCGSELIELTSATALEVFGPDDLPLSTELVLQPGELAATATVVAHAPVRLIADDGRISHFPRAWVGITMADGRRGVGWMEWNRNR